MGELKIEMRGLDSLIPYAKNPRKNEKAVDAVAQSIQQFGFKVPIVITAEGEIVAGHTRVLAARKLGLEAVPAVIASDLTPQQIKAFRIADNRSAEIAEWDYSLLDAELKDLAAEGFDVLQLGWKPGELEEFYGGGAQRGRRSCSRE